MNPATQHKKKQTPKTGYSPRQVLPGVLSATLKING